MATFSPMAPELLQKVLLSELNNQLRAALRDKFNAVAKEIVEEAIEAAMISFKPAVEHYYNLYAFESIIRVVLEDRRKT